MTVHPHLPDEMARRAVGEGSFSLLRSAEQRPGWVDFLSKRAAARGSLGSLIDQGCCSVIGGSVFEWNQIRCGARGSVAVDPVRGVGEFERGFIIGGAAM
eukprot:2167280-Rhodomonas_salina.1